MHAKYTDLGGRSLAYRTILQEFDCALAERYFHLGDTVKQIPSRPDDGMSGIVLEQHSSELLLRHVISEAPLPADDYVPEDVVELATTINPGGWSFQ